MGLETVQDFDEKFDLMWQYQIDLLKGNITSMLCKLGEEPDAMAAGDKFVEKISKFAKEEFARLRFEARVNKGDFYYERYPEKLLTTPKLLQAWLAKLTEILGPQRADQILAELRRRCNLKPQLVKK